MDNRGTNNIALVKILDQVENFSQSNEPWENSDSQMDVCDVDEHCLVVNDYDHSVSVSENDPHDGAKKYRTIPAAVAWTHPPTGQV